VRRWTTRHRVGCMRRRGCAGEEGACAFAMGDVA
jgi:hypothetical protein